MSPTPYDTARESTIAFEGGGEVAPRERAEWNAIVLTSGDPADENSFEDPAKVAPREIRLSGESGLLAHTFPAWSLTVLRVSGR
ncbi:MAG: hypothetical protein ACREIA_22485 [Opitutaceae bacterium]